MAPWGKHSPPASHAYGVTAATSGACITTSANCFAAESTAVSCSQCPAAFILTAIISGVAWWRGWGKSETAVSGCCFWLYLDPARFVANAQVSNKLVPNGRERSLRSFIQFRGVGPDHRAVSLWFLLLKFASIRVNSRLNSFFAATA